MALKYPGSAQHRLYHQYRRLRRWPHRCIRHSSSVANLESRLRQELTSRMLPLLREYLSPQPAYLLTRSIKDFLPLDAFWPTYTKESLSFKNGILAFPIPPGFHFAYFPTPASESQLLTDGTDDLHHPGSPFTRRLWAGGSIEFPPIGGDSFSSGQVKRAVCVERIGNVRVSGKEGEEKVFIEIERIMALAPEESGSVVSKPKGHSYGPDADAPIRELCWNQTIASSPDARLSKLITEHRQLVFLRPSSTATTVTRDPLRAPHQTSDFSHTLTPTPSLLFRYSALMFNAHFIHFDPEHTRLHDRQPNLLVHGPLLVTFMLACLSSLLSRRQSQALGLGTGGSDHAGKLIRSFSYRNFSPVFVNEPMTVRIKQKAPTTTTATNHSRNDMDGWDVWIEGPDGGLRVKGIAHSDRGPPPPTS